MKTIMVFLLILTANYSIADGLYAGAWSYHYYKEVVESEGTEVNSNQNLLAYEYKTYMVGYFKNSLYHDSVIASKYFNFYMGHDIDVGIHAGINYGYRWCGNDQTEQNKAVVCPHAMPSIKYTKYKLQPTIFAFNGGAAISLFWKIN